MKTKLKLFIITLSLIFMINIFYTRFTKGDNKMANIWGPFSQWYEWKKTTRLTPAQSDAINYFDKAAEVRETAQSDKLRDMAPDEAIAIIKAGIDKLSDTRVPDVCNTYHQALLKELEIGIEYNQARKAGASSEELQKITLKMLSIDGKKFTAFFGALEKVGLFEDYDTEVKHMNKK